MTRVSVVLICMLLSALAAGMARAQGHQASHGEGASIEAYYQVEDVPLPPGVNPQVGALAFMPGGRLVVAFHGGEIHTYDPAARAWRRFAAGLQEPLGLLAVRDDQVIVMQKPELTRVTDTDGDGQADHYETVTDGFGFTGNYHEFAYGPVRDAEGNLYIALNCASTGAGILPEIRGAYRGFGTTRAALERAEYPNSMYSVVPYRGWVLKVTPEGDVQPFASGFRSPNGILLDDRGRLFVADNQGDWIGTSRLLHVEEGKFYGHPVSLAWRPGWQGDPLDRTPLELDRLRTREAVAFPHGIMADSPGQLQVIPDGPFKGQLVMGEMDLPRVIRVLVEEVGGALQGAAIPMVDGAALGSGNNRLVYGPDGSLWVGKIHLKWAGGQGIQRITPTGRVPMDVQSIKLTEEGFELAFTHPIGSSGTDPDTYRFQRYFYTYHKAYGSARMDTADVGVRDVRVLPGGRRVQVALEDLAPGYVYQLDLSGLRAADGTPILNPLVVYTLNRLLDGTGPPPGHGVGLPEEAARRDAARGRPSP